MCSGGEKSEILQKKLDFISNSTTCINKGSILIDGLSCCVPVEMANCKVNDFGLDRLATKAVGGKNIFV